MSGAALAGGLPASAFSDWNGMSFGPDFSGVQPIGIQGSVQPISGPNLGSAAGPDPMKLGMNIPTAQLALGGLNTIGNLWGAFQAASLARKQFRFQRDYANTNLENQTKSYNTQLGDKVSTRAFVQGMSPDQAQSYLDANKLNYKKIG